MFAYFSFIYFFLEICNDLKDSIAKVASQKIDIDSLNVELEKERTKSSNSESKITSLELQIDDLKRELTTERMENLEMKNEIESLKKKCNDLELNEKIKNIKLMKRKLSQNESHRGDNSNKTLSPQTSLSSTSISQDSLKDLELDRETDIDSPVKRLKLNMTREQSEILKKKKFVIRQESPQNDIKRESSSFGKKSPLGLVPRRRDNASLDDILLAPSSTVIENVIEIHGLHDNEEALESHKSNLARPAINDESKDSNDNEISSPDQLRNIKEEPCSDHFIKQPVASINTSLELFSDSLVYVEPVSPKAISVITLDSSHTSDQDGNSASSWSNTNDLENCFRAELDEMREKYDGECDACARYYDKRMLEVPLIEVNMEIVRCKANCEGYRSRVKAIRSNPNYERKVQFMQANNRARRAVVENMDHNTPDGFWDLRLSPVKTAVCPKKY